MEKRAISESSIRSFFVSHEKREISQSPMPLLLISHGKWFERHLIYNVSANRYNKLNIPILRDKKVFSSSHGWLILLGYNENHCCLFNPKSMDIIELPPLDNHSLEPRQCILTKPPTEPDCHILFCNGFKLSFCRIGDNEFVNLNYLPGPSQKEECRYFNAIETFRGQTYGFIQYPREQFVSIHFLEKNLEYRPINLVGRSSLIPRFTMSHHTWLIEAPQESCYGGKVDIELLMIQKVYLSSISDTGFDFKIFRIDVNGGSYIEVLNLGKRTIFLSGNGGGYCCNFVEGVKPNCIYYLSTSEPDSKSNNRSFHIFDLKDGGTTSQLLSKGVGYHSLTCWVHKH